MLKFRRGSLHIAGCIEQRSEVFVSVYIAGVEPYGGPKVFNGLRRFTDRGEGYGKIGVRRRVNPRLREAGDGLGRADVTSIERLCAEYPDVKFLVTFLSRENQHELCVAARKFSNLMPFGCWWFLNNPSTVSEITRERFELLGQSFIPQHSDARVLEQLIYKWKHARRQIAEALCISYEQLLQNGRAVTRAEISRDVSRLFSRNFDEWIGV